MNNSMKYLLLCITINIGLSLQAITMRPNIESCKNNFGIEWDDWAVVGIDESNNCFGLGMSKNGNSTSFGAPVHKTVYQSLERVARDVNTGSSLKKESNQSFDTFYMLYIKVNLDNKTQEAELEVQRGGIVLFGHVWIKWQEKNKTSGGVQKKLQEILTSYKKLIDQGLLR